MHARKLVTLLKVGNSTEKMRLANLVVIYLRRGNVV